MDWLLSLDLKVKFDIVFLVGLYGLVFAHFFAGGLYLADESILILVSNQADDEGLANEDNAAVLLFQLSGKLWEL